MRGQHATLVRRYHPTYESPKRAYEAALAEAVQPGAAWLDVGCGRCISANAELDEELTRRAALVVGCDADPHLRRHSSIRNLVLCDAAALPFREGVFDLVTNCMVAEHLEDPERAFREVARVTKPRGRFIVFTPNKLNYAMIVARLTPHRFHVWYKSLTHYLNRGAWKDVEDDVFPTWYRANTVTRLRALLGAAGFEEKQLRRLALAHSFGFVRPLFTLSLLFERLIDRWPLEVLKADLLGVFERQNGASHQAEKRTPPPRRAFEDAPRQQHAQA
jgi:SAM-dependent methyltransferase